jgi:hypothetical protein
MGKEVIMYNNVPMIVILGFFACKERQSVSEVSAQSGSSELALIQEILGQSSTIGDCTLNSELINNNGREYLTLRLSLESQEGEMDTLKDLAFYNKQQNLGHVTLDRGFFDRIPYQIRLERVLLEAPARKIQVTIALKDNAPSEIRYKVMRGHAGNILKDIHCSNTK